MAQTGGVLRGRLSDDSGAVIPAATVRLSGNGAERTAVTGADGSWTFSGLAPASCSVRLDFPGFAPFKAEASVAAGQTVELPIQLRVAMEKKEVTVNDNQVPR